MIDAPNIYQAGNTVRLTCTFEDFDGNRVTPMNVKIIFYNHRYEKLQEVSLGSGNQIDTGVYVYNYTTSKEEEQRVVYEWSGEINGVSSLKRATFRTIFI